MKIFNGKESGSLGVATLVKNKPEQVTRRNWLRGAAKTLLVVGVEMATSGCGSVFQDAVNQENGRNAEFKQFVDKVIAEFGVKINPSSIVAEVNDRVCAAEARKGLAFGTMHSIMINPDLRRKLSLPSNQFVVLHELAHIVEPEGGDETVASEYAFQKIEERYGPDYRKSVGVETSKVIPKFWDKCKN